jgi:glucose-6-phosphate isomerase
MQEKINVTENRSVLHVALRAKKDQVIVVDGVNVVEQVHEVLEKVRSFSNEVRGKNFTEAARRRE